MKKIIKFKQAILSSGLAIIVVLLLFFTAYILKLSLVLPVLLLVLFIYFKKITSDKNPPVLILKVGLLLALFTAVSYAVVNYSAFSYYYLPVCAVSMLIVILFNDLKLALLATLFSSVEAGVIVSHNFSLSLSFLIGGLVACLCVWGSRRRAQIIKAGLIAGLAQVVCFMLFLPVKEWFSPLFFKSQALPLIANGLICAIFVSGSLSFFEDLFKVLTNISLLELSDFNHPLLKRMILEAPGTYQHSLVVGNLSEMAAQAISVNPLLARVGAYYHDIGKLEKAEYFSENQPSNLSKHDNIFPTISKLIIVNHVKDGAELAKKYGINPLIIDFILQHHGTSLTYYFYCRALEHMEHSEDVEEEGFRYPGPKPQTKEIAIVHLADSIEAATRTLKEPTPSAIEEMVRKIINNKFIDAQLDECELTLKDLEKIAEVFTRVLSVMYHSRIEYPQS